MNKEKRAALQYAFEAGKRNPRYGRILKKDIILLEAGSRDGVPDYVFFQDHHSKRFFKASGYYQLDECHENGHWKD